MIQVATGTIRSWPKAEPGRGHRHGEPAILGEPAADDRGGQHRRGRGQPERCQHPVQEVDLPETGREGKGDKRDTQECDPADEDLLGSDAVHQNTDQRLADGEHDHGEHDRAGELRPVPAELLRDRLEHDAEEEPRPGGDSQRDRRRPRRRPRRTARHVPERRLDLRRGPESIDGLVGRDQSRMRRLPESSGWRAVASMAPSYLVSPHRQIVDSAGACC